MVLFACCELQKLKLNSTGHVSLIESWVTSVNREAEKKWCRAGDWSSCVATGSDGRYEDASVALSDDRVGTLAVTLKKLRARDTGWYWCSVGQHKLSVHVQATPPTARKCREGKRKMFSLDD